MAAPTMATPLLLPLAAESIQGEAFELMAVGMGVVFTTLVAVFLMLLVLGRLKDAPAPAPKGRAQRPASAPDAAGGEIGPELIAVLIAAATAFTGRRVQVRSVRQVQLSKPARSWSESGRIRHHQSHRPRRN